MEAPAEVVRGIMTINVKEASGLNRDQTPVWDPNFSEGFVKVEIRGGSRNVKVQSEIKPVKDNSLAIDETLSLDLLEGSNELRLMLCKEKRTAGRVGSSVVAACGIYVSDILEAVPIDKYFELFKPKSGGDGGYIRILIDYTPREEEAAPTENGGKALLEHSLTLSKEIREGNAELPKGGKKGRFPWKIIAGLGAAAVAAAIAATVATKPREKREEQQ